MNVRTLRVSMFAALTTAMLFAGSGVARAQEGPIDHLRHRTHQIVRTTDRVIRHHRPVVRVYVAPRHRVHRHRLYHHRVYRYRHYDRRHHRYYYTYRRY